MTIERPFRPLPEGHGAGSHPALDKQRPAEAAEPPSVPRRRGRPPGPTLTPEQLADIAADQAARKEWQQQDFHEQVMAYCERIYPEPLTPEKLTELRHAFEAGHKTRSVDFAALLNRQARLRLELLEEARADLPPGASRYPEEDARLDVARNYVAVLGEFVAPPPSAKPEDDDPHRR